MRSWKVIPLFILILTALSGCSDTYEWNEKVTLEVETPDGLKTASSVQAITLVHTWFGLPEMEGVRTYFEGEAVVLEVLPGRYLFGLFSSERRPSQRFSLLYNRELDELYRLELGLNKGEFKNKEVSDRVALLYRLKGRSVTMRSLNYYPLLVTFKDINDPASVQKVHPLALDEFFGPGVKLKRVAIEITDEPVTRGRVEKVLGWTKTKSVPVNKDLPPNDPMRNVAHSFIRN